MYISSMFVVLVSGVKDADLGTLTGYAGYSGISCADWALEPRTSVDGSLFAIGVDLPIGQLKELPSSPDVEGVYSYTQMQELLLTSGWATPEE